MDEYSKSIYISEIEKQCEFANLAAIHINNWLLGPATAGSVPELFGYIHTFLTHASNVSKLFWPVLKTRGKNETDEQYFQRVPAAKRGEELREIYGLAPNDVLQDRDLRNHLEHFDERLDDMVKEVAGKSYADMIVGPVRQVHNALVVNPVLIMRHYDPDTGKLIFRNEPYDVGARLNAFGQLS